MNSKYGGFLLVLISSIGFGFMPIFATFAYKSNLSVEVVLLFRFLIAAVFLNIYIFIKNKSYPWGKSLIILIAMGGIGYSAQSFSFFSAVSLIGSSLTAVLFYMYPSLVLLLSLFVLKTKITTRDVIALIFVTLGSILVVGLKFDNINYVGVMFGITAAAIYAIYILVGTQALKNVDALIATTVIMSSASVTYALIGISNKVSIPTSLEQWKWLFAIAIFSTMLSMVTFLAGIKLIGPVKSSMISTFEPVVTLFCAFWLLNESMDMYQLLGALLIILAALILVK
jgi:drug/metabolite transporter (DMT)-like permease